MSYYFPIKMVLSYLVSENKNCKKVLEIGPGITPFPLATHFIDHVVTGENVINLDVCNMKFPFADDEFDLVYARHILEDVQNPVYVFKELLRVGKRGYVETPSIIAEVARNIDGGSPYWKGYVHHRYMFWNIDNRLFCIPKYPVIEYINTTNTDELLFDEFNWNCYYYWNRKEDASIKELKHDIDYNIFKDYESIINYAVSISKEKCQEFKNIVKNTVLL